MSLVTGIVEYIGVICAIVMCVGIVGMKEKRRVLTVLVKLMSVIVGDRR